MTKFTRRAMIYVTIAMAVLFFSVAFLIITPFAKVSAENEYLLNADFNMRVGASVRYYPNATDSETKQASGIRFSATLDKATYLALEELETTTAEGEESVDKVMVSYGMLIAPYSIVKTNDLTALTVFGYGDESGKIYTYEGENATGKTEIINITYDDLILLAGSTDYYEIKGSIINLKEINYTTEFVGRAYIKYEKGNSVEYKFANYYDNDIANNARSATYIAQKAQESITEDANAQAFVKATYIDGLAAAYKTTIYTVNTYVNGDLEKVEEKRANIGTQTVEPTAYIGFTLDEEKSDSQQVVYANAKTVLNMYYTADDTNVNNTQIANGGFENGTLDGWEIKGDIGGVSSDTNYFSGDELSVDGFAFGLDGTYMFSAFATSRGDEKVGWLKSSTFTVAENGWLTFKMGGGGDDRLLYIDVINAETEKILKRFANQNFTSDIINNIKMGCKLNAYKANLSDIVGTSVYLRITDADAGGSTKAYGTIFLDSFNAMHIDEPSDVFTLATDLLTDKDYNANALYNGDFTDGLAGWIENGEIGVVQNTTTYWESNIAYGNDGNFFAGYRTNGVGDGNSLEVGTGTLQSSPFVLGGTGSITFRIGGMRTASAVYLEILDWDTDKVYGIYYNENIQDATLVSYRADLSQYLGKTMYFKFVDTATSDWGLIFADDLTTYYETTPTIRAYDFAKNLVYNSFTNGSFERGLEGWTLENGADSGTTNATTYWADNTSFWWKEKEDGESNDDVTVQRFEKDGDNFYMSGDSSTGVLTSDTFKVAGDGILTFKLGGNSTDIRVEICLAETDTVIYTVVNEQYNDPLCAETMLRRYVDLKKYVGQNIYVRIVDGKEGGVGMATFDSMMLLSKGEVESIIAEDKAYYTAYYQKVNASITATEQAKRIVETLYNYYQTITILDAVA